MIRDNARIEALIADIRAFVRERWHPLEDQVSRDNDIPADLVQELRRKGYFGWSIPQAYGGLGLSTEELVLCAMELSQSSVALALDVLGRCIEYRITRGDANAFHYTVSIT